MAAYIDTNEGSPKEAHIDGASVFVGVFLVVLRSLPGVLPTAVFTWLVSWNDHPVAIVFSRTATTLERGVESFFLENAAAGGSVRAVAVVLVVSSLIPVATLNRCSASQVPRPLRPAIAGRHTAAEQCTPSRLSMSTRRRTRP